jgi:hypothetical protein
MPTLSFGETVDVGYTPFARLSLQSEGATAVWIVADFLHVLDAAYRSIWVFERSLATSAWLVKSNVGAGAAGDRHLSLLLNAVPPMERLLLTAVEFHSPGIWEFIGKLNPLEVIRLAINDAHERRKDREYRETAEQRRLELENAIREAGLLKEQIELAKAMGATKNDLRELLDGLVYRPLLRLTNYSERASIHSAEIEETERE